jgi:hypothetical protein
MDSFVKKESYTLDFVTGVKLPETTFSLNSIDVVGGGRRLRATWSPELAQDIEALHGHIDVEQELTNLLTQQINDEINEQIVRDIQRQGILERWRESGLLDGITNQLYESEATRILRDETNQEQRPLHDLELPLVRRVTARTLANDLVAVRPIGELRYNEAIDNQQTYQDEVGLHNYILNNTEDLITWRTENTWSYESLYGSLIGIQMDMKPLRMLPKKMETLFDLLD